MSKNRQPLLPTVTGRTRNRSIAYSWILITTSKLNAKAEFGGGGRDRTDDLMLAKHALSQLSYAPNQAPLRVSGDPNSNSPVFRPGLLSIHEKGCGDGVSVGQSHVGKTQQVGETKGSSLERR